jgi:Tfp pilus assembly protein PilN
VIGRAEKAGPLHVAVVMIEKGIAASYYDWFSQAGIPVSGFTTSAAVLYGLALESAPAFVISKQGEAAEILAVSSNAALLSKEVHTAALDRELQLCRSEMRLPDDADVRTIEQPDIAYAAGLSALTTRPFAINLLPDARRVYESPWTHAATYALAGVVALLLVAVGLRGTLQDHLYLRHVNDEIRLLEPKVKHIQKLEGKEGRQLTQITTLAALRGRTPARLRILAELTRLLPATVSLADADISDEGVTISGYADSASGLLALLGTSSQFRNPEFLSAISKNNEGKEVFRIHMQLTGGQP